MKPLRWRAPRPWQLAAYLEGELGASDASAVERYLAESTSARRELEQLKSVRAALANSGREFAEVDLLPSLRTRIREHTEIRLRPSESIMERLLRRPAAALVAAGLVTVAVCLAVGFAPRTPSAQGFRAKSAGQTVEPARWAGIHVYRVRAGKPERLAETLTSSDGLLFSYTNLGREPLANLMIFAVDSRGEVHWFHPGYEHEGTNPSSIVIEKSVAQAPLAELIQAEFPPGSLTIHGLFSSRPLHVLEVEAWLKADPRTSLAERVPGSVDQILTTRIEP